MMAWIAALPMFVLLIGLAGLSMAVPAVHALIADDGASARGFGYASLLTIVFFLMLAVATTGQKIRFPVRSYLLSIVAFFSVLPVLLAWPLTAAMQGSIGFGTAMFDMISAITTTGAPILPHDSTPSSVHLWRAEIAWLGGFFIWVVAAAVLVPLNLGGIEVAEGRAARTGDEHYSQISGAAGPGERLRRFSAILLPVYAGLTLALWVLLLAAGDPPLVAVIHAMSTLSTSGLSPLSTPSTAASGVVGEVLVFFFLVFGLSRVTFMRDARQPRVQAISEDPEIRLGLMIIVALPVLLFLRHWIASFEAGQLVAVGEGIEGVWGAMFTTASFLTTTGWESSAWSSALSWSGLRTPGLLLLGLAIFGGGVATTAGGVKLFRVFALYKHGLREMEKLVQPSSIGGAGQLARRIRRQGAYLAWITFMLFALSIAAVWVALAATGIPFEDALVLTVAFLSNCGPLVISAANTPIAVSDLSGGVMVILSAAMVLGRVEALALIALLNPDFWRR